MLETNASCQLASAVNEKQGGRAPLCRVASRSVQLSAESPVGRSGGVEVCARAVVGGGLARSTMSALATHL